jgi:hypothetical protein
LLLLSCPSLNVVLNSNGVRVLQVSATVALRLPVQAVTGSAWLMNEQGFVSYYHMIGLKLILELELERPVHVNCDADDLLLLHWQLQEETSTKFTKWLPLITTIAVAL